MKKSNLYVERIYSEHPLSSWPLDDDITFFQLLSDNQQDLNNWQHSNATQTFPDTFYYTPTNGINSKFILNGSSSGSFISRIESSFTLNSLSDFNLDKTTGCFSVNVYSDATLVYKYRIGVTIDSVDYFTDYDFTGGWQILSHTFNIPTTNKNIEFFISIFSYNSESETVQFNGPSVGQWSEPYVSFSNGFNENSVPTTLQQIINSYSGYNVVPLDAYGIDSESNGYYLVKNKTCFVKPSGIPLAYGSYQSLRVYQAPDLNPSFIFPGHGLLNDAGKYNSYTLEMWVRLRNISINPIRIIGPVKSTDGIYLEEGFISLYIGPYTKSYFLGKFNRPMLLNLQYSEQRASLYINGEEVIAIDLDVNNLSFPSKVESGYSQDWIGVYGNESIEPFEIDSISLFPYLLPPDVSKKHFVYGQGVQEYEFTSPEFLKRTVEFDFPYSEYAYNVIYPDTMKWRSGYSNNIDTTSTYLTMTNEYVPEIISKINDVAVEDSQWLYSQKLLNNLNADLSPYFEMSASGQYSDATIYFDRINILPTDLESIFGYFKSPESPMPNQIVMSFNNNSSGEKLEFLLDSNTLKYVYTDMVGASTQLHSDPVTDESYFTAGINITRLSASSYFTIGSFFSNLDRISLNVGGYGQKMFKGRIFGIHFNNSFFFDKDIDQYFSGSFIDQPTGADILLKYIGNYSMLPVFKNITMGIDIGISGYWEDIIPLSMFGKTVSASGTQVYDLDMIQFNIDTPYQLGYGANDSINFSYSMISSVLGVNTYADLVALGYTSYQDMVDDFILNYGNIKYDSSITSYITLQNYAVAGNKSYADFINITNAPQTKVIEPNTGTLSNTKYEIFDNTVILIPDTINFMEYYLGIHIEMRIRGVLERNLVIKRMELASFVANEDTETKIGTKYSYPVYPFAVAQ